MTKCDVWEEGQSHKIVNSEWAVHLAETKIKTSTKEEKITSTHFCFIVFNIKKKPEIQKGNKQC